MPMSRKVMKNCRRGGAPNVAALPVFAEALFSTKSLSPGLRLNSVPIPKFA
jgi:hypothetical protein